MRNYLPYILYLLALLSFSCNTAVDGKVSETGGNTSGGEKSNTGTKGGKADYMVFKKTSLMDEQGTHSEALSLLIPKGWKMDGQVFWQMDNASFPANATLKVNDPTGDLQFQFFPASYYFYTQNYMTLASFPYGSKYMGCWVVNEVPTAVNALANYVLPQVRKNVQNLKVVESKVLIPETRQVIGQNIYSRYEGVVLKLEYTENGKAYEENLYGMRSVTESPGSGFNNWMLTNCYAFKAPKGKLADNMKVFQTMLNSMRINKQWYNNFVQVSQMLTQQTYRSIAAAGQISRIISQTNDEISKTISDSYWNNQKAQDKVYENFSDYIRGVDTYTDPTSNESYKLPAGYDEAWKSAQGEYIISNTPGFNPNEVDQQSWEKLEKKQ